MTNRLWQQLHRYYPQMLSLSPAADDPFLWDLLRAAPTPKEGAKIRRARVERILTDNRIRRLGVDEVLLALKEAPLVLAAGAGEAACEHVLLLLPHVSLLDRQLRDVGLRIKEILARLTEPGTELGGVPCDAALMLSIPGIGPAIAAALLTEATRPIRERDYQALRCYAGTAPVTAPGCVRPFITGLRPVSIATKGVASYMTTCERRDIITHGPCGAWPTGCSAS